ncbi:DNA polymerase alpha subunit B isoform X2 [Achroia grisella]|uniref:DNA polymerase alpha subunit B isoform X2 n=1 Tax=Achroia grisella TaxID=688607 RepID=UPI0027D22C8F|nr:DNA polymerase alpha subunit B isoform X2 [Achroia grisella]
MARLFPLNNNVLSNYMTVAPKRVKLETEVVSSHQTELRPPTYSPIIERSLKYSSRPNPGTVVHSYGDEKQLELISQSNNLHDISNLNIVQIPNDDGDLYTKATFGFEMLHEKASIFDNHLTYLSQYIMKKAGITESTSTRHKTQTVVTVAGRIECDADARLNPKSVMLQGTWEESLSQAVPVDIDNVTQYSLFPGQVVVMRGINQRGDQFIAHEILSDASKPIPDPKADMLNYLEGKLSIMMAAGPYTTSDNMAYEPLRDFITYIGTHRPHVVIMTGPFMDVEHSKIKDNSMAETYKSYFEKLIDNLAEVHKTSPSTNIYIVSSVKDVFHVNIYPTPPYSTRRKYQNIHFLPDPCTININGVVVGLTSTDVLMSINNEEISCGTAGGVDKLSRLCGHLVRQQSYSPLWPPPATRPTDAALWAAHSHLPCTPHLMLLPSNFRYFVKEVNGCVMVNPEHLTKGQGGGTFARILVDGSLSPSEFISAQIIRI